MLAQSDQQFGKHWVDIPRDFLIQLFEKKFSRLFLIRTNSH